MIRVCLFLAISTVLVERRVSERDLLRGFAFSKCLADGYAKQNPAFAQDARHVAELYRDAGRTTRTQVYVRLEGLAASAKPSTPAAVDNSNLAIMRCLELYESDELKRALKEAH